VGFFSYIKKNAHDYFDSFFFFGISSENVVFVLLYF